MRPKISLISSFSLNGPISIKEAWPKGMRHADLYTFMQSDVHYYLPEAIDAGCRNALEAFEWACDHQEIRLQLSKRICEIYENCEIVAFSTFLPELMAHEWSEQWIKAQKAVRFLIDLARLLNVSGHPIETIQLTGGGSTNGVWRALMLDQSEGYVLNRISEERSIERLISRISDVAAYAAIEPSIRLAFDMEPGPLFALGNKERLARFCELVATSDDVNLRQVVGVNLSIGHWDFLGEITPDWLKKPEQKHIFNRIIHCHVADYKKGNFGDQIVRTFHPEERFKAWVSLLEERMLSTALPTFSGFISCRSEACHNAGMLKEAVDRSQKL